MRFILLSIFVVSLTHAYNACHFESEIRNRSYDNRKWVCFEIVNYDQQKFIAYCQKTLKKLKTTFPDIKMTTMSQCPRDADAICYNSRNLAVYDNGGSKQYYERQKKRCLGSNGEWKQSKQ